MVRDWNGCSYRACKFDNFFVDFKLCEYLTQLTQTNEQKSVHSVINIYKCGYMYMKFKFSKKINNFSYIYRLLYTFSARVIIYYTSLVTSSLCDI